jgi:hypothetical protein
MAVMYAKRIVWLILFLVGGSGSILYGWIFHTATVEVEKERQISIATPTLSGLDPSSFERHADVAPRPLNENHVSGGGKASDGIDPFRSQPGAGNPEDNPFETPSVMSLPPGIKIEQVAEKYLDDFITPEYAIVRDVTVGGIVRLANGQLKRTYSGKTPSLCPS